MNSRTLLVTIIFLLLVPSCAYAEKVKISSFTIGSNQYYINNELKQLDIAPFLKNDRAFVPLDYVTDILRIDNKYLWDEKTKTVTLINDGIIEEQLTIDSNIMNVLQNVGDGGFSMDYGGKVAMDVTPVIVNGKVFLPVRYIAEHFRIIVDWDAKSQTVTISELWV